MNKLGLAQCMGKFVVKVGLAVHLRQCSVKYVILMEVNAVIGLAVHLRQCLVEYVIMMEANAVIGLTCIR